jgi:hypothetical protein
VTVQECLQIAIGRGQPGRLLDLEHELAPGGPVRAGPEDDEVRGIGQRGSDRLGSRCIRGAGGKERRGDVGVGGRAGEVAGHGRRGQDRRHVADRVAPALVHLVRGEQHVRERGTGRAVASRDQRRPRAGGARGLERPVRRSGSALVRDPDHERVGRRSYGELECLLRRDPGALAQRLAQDLDDGLGAVLARAAAGDDDRAAALRGLPNRDGELRGARVRVGEAHQEATGQVRLGRDHVGHVPRWAVPRRWL